MQLIEQAGRRASASEPTYVEDFSVPDLSVGTYSLPAGSVDDQEPHTEDEVYVVTEGRARFRGGDVVVDVGPGSVLFVPAGEDHRFLDITEDLVALVFFGPAQYARATNDPPQ